LNEFPETLPLIYIWIEQRERKNWKMFLFGTLSGLAYHFSPGQVIFVEINLGYSISISSYLITTHDMNYNKHVCHGNEPPWLLKTYQNIVLHAISICPVS
jgi:hypothetical protein